MKYNLSDPNDFLLEGLEYYCGNVERRCTSKRESCYYSPKSLSMKNGMSDGCFIGRHLRPEDGYVIDQACKRIGTKSTGIKYILGIEEFSCLIPEFIRQHNIDFLIDCQNLHDYHGNWDNNGLSIKGRDVVRYIISKYNLNMNLFEKFLK